MEGSNGYKKGLWTMEEDRILMDYIRVHGKGKWNRVAKMTGLKRCGKSCRLRWINYLSPSVKRGDFSEEEDDLIIRLHNLLGNRWSLIAGRVPGRTDNQVKNHWNTHLSKKLGVKEDKRKFKVSSRTISKCEKNMLNTNSKNCFPDDNGIENVDVKVTGEGPQSPIGCSSVEEPALSDDLEGCFWFSNDNLNIDNPSLTELLDGYSLDFVWQGL